MRRSLVFGWTCLALALVAAAPAFADLRVGVKDDGGKYGADNGAWFFSKLEVTGLRDNIMTILWDPARPATIVDKQFLDRSLPVAADHGVNVIFSVYPVRARAIGTSPTARKRFANFLKLLARTYPQVRNFIVGNEPNQPRFWQPQFTSRGKPAAGYAYEALLAQSYDALKSVDRSLNVIGVAVSARGNDDPRAQSNVSTSPLRFVHDLGVAYRASGRALPLMDEFAVHPYPNSSKDSLMTGYKWPNVGVPNLGRLKQSIWDAFHDTAQPTVEDGLQLFVAEAGWQVGIVAGSQSSYEGVENSATTTEENQAKIYGQMARYLACDASVSALEFFGLTDQPDLAGFQAGLMRVDRTPRASLGAVTSWLRATDGRCTGRPIAWRHATSVAGAKAVFRVTAALRSPKQRAWNFSATVGEDATYRAGIYRIGARRTAAELGRQLRAPTKGLAPVLAVSGRIRAGWRPLVRFPPRSLPPGVYVYAMRVRAIMNPARQKVFVSRRFRVGEAFATSGR